MPSIQAIADALSTTFTDERYPLGTLYVQTDAEVKSGVSNVDTALDFAKLQGERVWVFVQAIEAVTAGQLCEYDAASVFGVEPCDADSLDPMLVAGVADNDIAANSYGWIIKRGTCVVLTETSVTAGAAVDSDGAGAGEGYVEATGGAATTLGRALEDEGATKANYAQTYINIP